MAEVIKLLMIDDHPLILEGYKSKLHNSYNKDQYLLLIDTASNCDEAYSKIEKSVKEGPYHIILLDINLPASNSLQMYSGEDLGKYIIKKSPDSSLIVLTMYSENIRLLNILKNLDPDAFLIKSDVTPGEFLKAFNNVLERNVYYSQTITNIMRQKITSDIILDEYDRNILFHLAEGIRTKDLVDIIPLSLAAIEKRKKMMKEIFEVEKSGDLALINQARKLGFL